MNHTYKIASPVSDGVTERAPSPPIRPAPASGTPAPTPRERLVDTIVEGAPTIKAWGGRILILVGAWFITFAVFANHFSDLFPV